MVGGAATCAADTPEPHAGVSRQAIQVFAFGWSSHLAAFLFYGGF